MSAISKCSPHGSPSTNWIEKSSGKKYLKYRFPGSDPKGSQKITELTGFFPLDSALNSSFVKKKMQRLPPSVPEAFVQSHSPQW